MSHRTGAAHRHAVGRSAAEAVPFRLCLARTHRQSFPKWTYSISLAAGLESTSTKPSAGLNFLATGQVMIAATAKITAARLCPPRWPGQRFRVDGFGRMTR
jgi:hypothetical protein